MTDHMTAPDDTRTKSTGAMPVSETPARYANGKESSPTNANDSSGPRVPTLPGQQPLSACLVELAQRHVASGTIVVLSTGDGTASLPLREAGFRCVAVEIHHDTPQHDFATLRETLESIADIRAFCLNNVLEYLPDPLPLLEFLREYALTHGAPALLLSVPNVAHHDVAFNLLAGKWDVPNASPAGTLYGSHFTRESLQRTLARGGWEIASTNDHVLEKSPVYDPESILHSDSLLGQLLRYVSDLFNPDHHVYQFVLLAKPATQIEARDDRATITNDLAATRRTEPRPLVSILMRTQGLRNELMTEALLSVFAQDCSDYELIICFHNPDDKMGHLFRGVEELLAEMPAELQREARVIRCDGIGRSAPLNDLYEAARGEYLTILDDDDLLFPRHVSVVAQGVETHGIGAIFHTYAVQREIDVLTQKVRNPAYGFTRDNIFSPHAPSDTFPYSVRRITPTWAKPFDPVKQQYANGVHVSNFFIPRRLIEQTRLRFRNDFEYGEDWQFWMEASQILKVITLPEITGVQNVRTNGTNTVGRLELQPEWITSHRRRFAIQERHPLVLDGRVSQLIYRQHERADRDYAYLERKYEDMRAKYDEQSEWAKDLERQIQEQGEWAKGLERQLLTRPRPGPLQLLGGLLRRFR